MKEYLTIGQTADFLNVSHSYVLDLLGSGAFPSRFVGSEFRVLMDDLAPTRLKALPIEQRRRKHVGGASMGNDVDPLKKPPGCAQ